VSLPTKSDKLERLSILTPLRAQSWPTWKKSAMLPQILESGMDGLRSLKLALTLAVRNIHSALPQARTNDCCFEAGTWATDDLVRVVTYAQHHAPPDTHRSPHSENKPFQSLLALPPGNTYYALSSSRSTQVNCPSPFWYPYTKSQQRRLQAELNSTYVSIAPPKWNCSLMSL